MEHLLNVLTVSRDNSDPDSVLGAVASMTMTSSLGTEIEEKVIEAKVQELREDVDAVEEDEDTIDEEGDDDVDEEENEKIAMVEETLEMVCIKSDSFN
jgi:hypothetical protein